MRIRTGWGTFGRGKAAAKRVNHAPILFRINGLRSFRLTTSVAVGRESGDSRAALVTFIYMAAGVLWRKNSGGCRLRDIRLPSVSLTAGRAVPVDNGSTAGGTARLPRHLSSPAKPGAAPPRVRVLLSSTSLLRLFID